MEEFLKELVELCKKHEVDLTTCYSSDQIWAQKEKTPQVDFQVIDGELLEY